MDNHLNDAINLFWLADGREGPEDAQHATQLVIARALVSIAQSLERIAWANEPAWLNDVLNERSEAVHLLNVVALHSDTDTAANAVEAARQWLAERD